MDVEKIINLIGGHEELQKLLKVNKSAISNYKKGVASQVMLYQL